MLTKIINLKLWQQTCLLLVINTLGMLTYFFGIQAWNFYVLAGLLSTLGLIYFAMWSVTLIRAKFERNYWFFAGALAYWLLLGGLVAMVYLGIGADLGALVSIITLTGAFIGIAMFGTFAALIPVVIFGAGITIWLWIQAVQEAKEAKAEN